MSERERASVVDVMHRGVIGCAGESSALAVARIMAAHRIHCVTVIGADRLPGIVTDVDIASAMYDDQLETLTAEDLARPAPLLRVSDSLAYAQERMHEAGRTHALVVRPSLRVLGVLSILDVIEWLLGCVDHRRVATFHG